MRIYNTYSKQLETLEIKDNVVSMYNCGPTVYDYAHIGNFRSFLFADLLRRYLEFRGFEVKQVMNFTDVGHMTQDDLVGEQSSGQNQDKMAVAAKKTGIKDPIELANVFIDAFMKDSKELRCKEPMERPRASEHVKEMIDIIEKLIEKKHAYEVDGYVYFEESSFKNYGKLSGNSPEDLIAGHRVEIDPNKKKVTDFALWKHNKKHIMKWDSPWGEGFPGWHIECSAMAMKYLGETLDIHTGGEDNIFPHHEAEIAQSEGATNKAFARYWIHVRHLLVDGVKMSKSKGNFFTVKDLLQKGYRGEEIRYALISSHYRQNMNFTTGLDKDANKEKYLQIEKIEALEEARTAIRRISDFLQSMQEVSKKRKNVAGFNKLLEQSRSGFIKAMDEDLNIAEAFSSIFTFIHQVNKIRDEKTLGVKAAEEATALIKEFDEVLGILPKKEKVPEKILQLVEDRKEARLNKDYAKADQIRDQIKEMGYIIEDNPKGTICKKI